MTGAGSGSVGGAGFKPASMLCSLLLGLAGWGCCGDVCFTQLYPQQVLASQRDFSVIFIGQPTAIMKAARMGQPRAMESISAKFRLSALPTGCVLHGQSSSRSGSQACKTAGANAIRA